MELKDIEFYNTPSGDVQIYEVGKSLRVYLENDVVFTSLMIKVINESYPEAFKALSELYAKSEANIRYLEYLIVHRFIRCNFGEYDDVHDIDYAGAFRFEHVKCPLRGECKLFEVVCSPKFNSKLTDREHEVMRLYYNSFSSGQIADRLNISPATIEKHKSNVLRKLDLHSLSEFNVYASKHNLFS